MPPFHFTAVVGADVAVPAKALHVLLRVGRTNLLLRNIVRIPVVELEASEIETSELGAASGGL